MGRVIIGMDPHKRSATIEIINEREKVLAQGRFGTDRDGYRRCSTPDGSTPDRVWAVEGCNGIGRHIAQRLVADGETVRGRAGEAVRAGPGVRHRPGPQDRPGRRALASPSSRCAPTGLRHVTVDDTTVALRLLVDRRDGLGRARTDTRQPDAQAAAGTRARRREEVPVRPAGPRPAEHRPPARHRRAHPPAAGLRADHRTRRHRQEDQSRQQRS